MAGRLLYLFRGEELPATQESPGLLEEIYTNNETKTRKRDRQDPGQTSVASLTRDAIIEIHRGQRWLYIHPPRMVSVTYKGAHRAKGKFSVGLPCTYCPKRCLGHDTLLLFSLGCLVAATKRRIREIKGAGCPTHGRGRTVAPLGATAQRGLRGHLPDIVAI